MQSRTAGVPSDVVVSRAPGRKPIVGRRFGDLGIGSGTGRTIYGARELERGGGANLSGAGRVGSGNNNNNAGVPRGEQRFVPDEVITRFAAGVSPQQIAQLSRRNNLMQLETQSLPLIGATLYRWRIGGRRSVPSVVDALGSNRIIASVQPNFLFTLEEEPSQNAAASEGDPAQYVLAKLQIGEAHRIATGKDVPVAVIDSDIDVRHPDLDGTIVKSFNALGGEEKPQQHGTGMAGAIFSHGKLLGIAPQAELLAERAFDEAPGGGTGTSFAIYKSLQWAADNGARVINMSFAGPPDPTMHQMLAAAYEKDIVLVAAAGNAGPKSAPLYPGADPNVIAVTATDSNDGLFAMANRGPYVAVAAPGVDVLVLAPDDTYRPSTGTSVAAAHVSGIAALLLQAEPSLKPKDVRSILMTTARPLGLAGQQSDFGAGLVNAYRAVIAPEGKSGGNNDGHAQAKR